MKHWRGLQWLWTQETFRNHSALWGLDGQEPKTLHSWPVYFLFLHSSWLEKTAAPCHLVKKSSSVETGNDSLGSKAVKLGPLEQVAWTHPH